eukprot:2270508-Prymnesium_polylepis.1
MKGLFDCKSSSTVVGFGRWLKIPEGDRFSTPEAAWPQELRPLDSWRFWCPAGLTGTDCSPRVPRHVEPRSQSGNAVW